MKVNKKGFGLIPVLLIVIFAGVAGTIGWLVYQKNQDNKKPDVVKSYSPNALMSVTSSGGLCNGPCGYPIYNLYDDGSFEGHKRLNSSELSELINHINTTDFLKYPGNPNANCASSYDGSDTVLLFPKKYGDKTTTPCQLSVPENDHAFGFIYRLIDSHTVKSP